MPEYKYNTPVVFHRTNSCVRFSFRSPQWKDTTPENASYTAKTLQPGIIKIEVANKFSKEKVDWDTKVAMYLGLQDMPTFLRLPALLSASSGGTQILNIYHESSQTSNAALSGTALDAKENDPNGESAIQLTITRRTTEESGETTTLTQKGYLSMTEISMFAAIIKPLLPQIAGWKE